MILVDTNVLLDIYKADPVWMPWSVRQLRSAKSVQLAINMVVYAELAGHPAIPQRIDKFLDTLGIEVLDLTRPEAKLAGLAFRLYRKRPFQPVKDSLSGTTKSLHNANSSANELTCIFSNT